MKPNEFRSFDNSTPDILKDIIVTNNINSLDANGHLRQVWIGTFIGDIDIEIDGTLSFHVESDGTYNEDPWIPRFEIPKITHWKYA